MSLVRFLTSIYRGSDPPIGFLYGREKNSTIDHSAQENEIDVASEEFISSSFVFEITSKYYYNKYKIVFIKMKFFQHINFLGLA